MCGNDAPEINIYNTYPELITEIKDEHVYNVIMLLHEKQEFSFHQFDTLLLLSHSMHEIEAIHQVYLTMVDMIIDYELNQILYQLDCPLSVMKMVKLATVRGIHNTDNLKQITKRIYPVIQSLYPISLQAIGTRLRSAIETMYLYNSAEIYMLCGNYTPIQTGAPTIKVFLQSLVDSIKVKQKRFEFEMNSLLKYGHVLTK